MVSAIILLESQKPRAQTHQQKNKTRVSLSSHNDHLLFCSVINSIIHHQKHLVQLNEIEKYTPASIHRRYLIRKRHAPKLYIVHIIIQHVQIVCVCLIISNN